MEKYVHCAQSIWMVFFYFIRTGGLSYPLNGAILYDDEYLIDFFWMAFFWMALVRALYSDDSWEYFVCCYLKFRSRFMDLLG